MKSEKKHGTKRISFFLMIAVLLFTAIYVIVQLAAILHRTYRTETAITYTMADSVPLRGIAAYDYTDVYGAGNLGYLVQDGERVTGGTVLAECYTDPEQGILRERLDRINQTIDLLTKSQNSTGTDLSVLTSQTKQALYNLLDQLENSSYQEISTAGDAFLLAQNRLQVSTGQTGNFDRTIAELQSERDALQLQLENLATIQAEQNGYFISASTTPFLSFDRQLLEEATPTDLQSLLDTGVPVDDQGLVGRIATGFSWWFYGTCTAETAARFNVNSKVSIRVPGKQNVEMSAVVESVTVDEETGVAKVVLKCQNINADVLRLGQEEAQIDLTSYTGIRVDRAALHIVDGAKGVYVKYGNLQRFRKITILYENENYLLIPATGALGTANEVRLYDEIIVEGTNLQDGRLL